MNEYSTKQALSVWSDLWLAYFGKNGYGSDTAEIYAYRLCPDMPTKYAPQGFDQEKTEQAIRAARDMIDLLFYFQEQANCRIEVDKEPLAGWMASKVFDHRWHIKVIPNDSV